VISTILSKSGKNASVVIPIVTILPFNSHLLALTEVGADFGITLHEGLDILNSAGNSMVISPFDGIST
jgi:hypothetical protein